MLLLFDIAKHQRHQVAACDLLADIRLTCRHDYPLPYALVTREVDERITEAINGRRVSMYHSISDKERGEGNTILQSTFKVTDKERRFD